MQQIRVTLRGTGVVLMGKNTMMRKAISGHLERNPALQKYVIKVYLFIPGFVSVAINFYPSYLCVSFDLNVQKTLIVFR